MTRPQHAFGSALGLVLALAGCTQESPVRAVVLDETHGTESMLGGMGLGRTGSTPLATGGVASTTAASPSAGASGEAPVTPAPVASATPAQTGSGVVTGSAPTTDVSSDGSGADPESTVDVFGIKKLYRSADTGALWTAQHWFGAGNYDITTRQDEHDPLHLSGMRGTGTVSVSNGILTMGGGQPRLYVYAGEAGPWQNVEVTVYYQRVADDGTDWGGLVIGARSGPEGHGDTPCDAHTYYSRLRHDGATDFEKELMHTPSSTQSRVEPSQVWSDSKLPFNRWIGWKYVIYNLPNNAGVKLESYRDMTDGADGGTWELLNATTDAGGWFTQTSCPEQSPVNGQSDLVYYEGGATFIRDTGVTEARYRWLTIREIEPTSLVQ